MLVKSPIEAIVAEMNGCVKAKLSLGAISLAVALPSICASLELEDGRSNGEDYKRWCSENLYPNKGFDLISPDELLSLRNGFAHQNRSELLNNKKGKLERVSETARVVFILENNGVAMEDSTVRVDGGDLCYAYNISAFCEKMGLAVMQWYKNSSENQIVARNIGKMATYRPFTMGAVAVY